MINSSHIKQALPWSALDNNPSEVDRDAITRVVAETMESMPIDEHGQVLETYFSTDQNAIARRQEAHRKLREFRLVVKGQLREFYNSTLQLATSDDLVDVPVEHILDTLDRKLSRKPLPPLVGHRDQWHNLLALAIFGNLGGNPPWTKDVWWPDIPLKDQHRFLLRCIELFAKSRGLAVTAWDRRTWKASRDRRFELVKARTERQEMFDFVYDDLGNVKRDDAGQPIKEPRPTILVSLPSYYRLKAGTKNSE